MWHKQFIYTRLGKNKTRGTEQQALNRSNDIIKKPCQENQTLCGKLDCAIYCKFCDSQKYYKHLCTHARAEARGTSKQAIDNCKTQNKTMKAESNSM